MITDNESRKNLVNCRIEQAFQTAADAKYLIDDNKLVIAVNRLYYAMFYMLTALTLFD
jgi:uncharacterized protein (UPF0332 family)